MKGLEKEKSNSRELGTAYPFLGRERLGEFSCYEFIRTKLAYSANSGEGSQDPLQQGKTRASVARLGS